MPQTRIALASIIGLPFKVLSDQVFLDTLSLLHPDDAHFRHRLPFACRIGLFSLYFRSIAVFGMAHELPLREAEERETEFRRQGGSEEQGGSWLQSVGHLGLYT
jgi:hypothetical protein